MNALFWLDESMSLRLVQALLHFLWQGCAVALVVVLAGRMLRHASAQARYSFSVAALLVMVLCLPVTFLLVDLPRHPESGREPVLGHPTLDSTGPSAAVAVAQGERTAVARALREGGQRLVRGSRPWSRLIPPAPYVVAGYFCGVALMMIRLSMGLQGGRRLCRSAIPVDDSGLLAMIGEVVRRMGLKAAPAVGYCERISVPIVVGVLKPMILLPAALASGLSPDQLQALLAHELAHVRRFDLVVNLVQRLAEAVLFFHPAVWFISRRVSTEREIAADDLVIEAGWPRVRYADALVRMAELSSALRRTGLAQPGIGLAAWGSDESAFKHRVLHLLVGDDRPMLRLSRGGWSLFLGILLAVALSPLLVQAWTPATSGARVKPSPSETRRVEFATNDSPRDETQASPPTGAENSQPRENRRPDLASQGQRTEPPSRKSSPKTPSPNIILSAHVILWDNQIVSWDQVVARLRALRKSGPFRATFLSTNGLDRGKDGWKGYHDRIMTLYPEIFEPVGVSFGSISPRASARYDAIRTAADLRPDPAHARSGQVDTPQGDPAQEAQVVVLPAAGPFALLPVALSGTQLRDPLDEQWSPTDAKGHFVVHPKDDEFVMVLHPSGFAIQDRAGIDGTRPIQLQPWATLTFRSTGDVADQHASVSVRPTGLRPGAPALQVYSIETKGKPVEIKVPAGEIVVSRSLSTGQGTSVALPVETFTLNQGESRVLEIKPPSDADRERARGFLERHGQR